MKTLVVYYSFEGNCRDLAAIMAEATGGDTAAIRPEKESIPDAGFLNLLKGGSESIMRKMPALLPMDKNPDDYDLVIVGGPVWAWNIAPATRAFLAGRDWKGKAVGVFCMQRGMKGVALSAMRSLVEGGNGRVVGERDFRDLRMAKPKTTRENAAEWARQIAAAADAQRTATK